MITQIMILAGILLNACTPNPNLKIMNEAQESIITAVQKGQTDKVEVLLKAGTDVNTCDKRRQSLLLMATRANDVAMAGLLVKHGADVNRQDDIQDSPFLYAGAAGHLELVQLFLANGARFDIFNRYNGSALIPACERGHVPVVKLLANTKGFPIDHVNRLGWTALMEAVVLGNGSAKYVEIVQILADAGCNINIPDNEGVTALQHAKSRSFTGIVKVLEKAAAK